MNKVAKNAVWIIGGKIAQALLALVINMLTARYLGPSNFGMITYAASLVAFALPVMQLGFDATLVQEIVEKPELEGQYLGTAILLNFVSSIFCVISVALFVWGVNSGERETFIVCLLYSFVLPFQALDQIVYWYQAKLRSKYTSIIGLIAYIIVSAYKIFLLVEKKSIYWFAISNAFDYALIAIAAFVLYQILGGKKMTFSLSIGKEMFKKSKYYIFPAMMVTIFAQTDKLMIKMMIDETATGYYGAAVSCAGLSGFVFTAIIDSFRPAIFEGKNIDENIFRKRLAMLYSVTIYLSLIQSAIMTMLSKYVVDILYGKEYLPAVNALRIIVWYTTFSYLGAIRNIWMLANKQQKYLWKINLIGAIANVAMNLILIPILGINGAAIASLLTQLFTNVVVGYVIKPIRPNNDIMLESLNPQYLLLAFKKMWKKNNV